MTPFWRVGKRPVAKNPQTEPIPVDLLISFLTVHFARSVVRAAWKILMLTAIAGVLIVLSIAILVAHALDAFRSGDTSCVGAAGSLVVLRLEARPGPMQTFHGRPGPLDLSSSTIFGLFIRVRQVVDIDPD
jgi:hypothetical protein